MPKKQSDSPAPETSRESLLREAAALARQGKLDQAVRQYEAALEWSPYDWGTANLVGDLWLKLGDATAAKRHFDNAAGRLADEGFHAKASALFKKILKIWPDDENARVRLGEIAERQELFADSDTHYRAAIALRKARGDMEGAQALEERLRVRPADPDASSGAAPPAPAAAATGAASDAAERWTRAVALTPEARRALVREIEVGAAGPRPARAAGAVYTTESWGADLITTVVGALDGVQPAVPAFDALKCRASLQIDGDAWRLAVRRSGKPEWLQAAESVAARAEAARALHAPMAAEEVALDLAALPEPEEERAPAPVSQAGDDEPLEMVVDLASGSTVESHPQLERAVAHVAGERPDVGDINVLFEALRTTFVAAHAAEARGWFARGQASMVAGDLATGIPA